MNTHLIKIEYNDTNQPSVFMAKSFTRNEILSIASEICENFANVHYNELKTTIVCSSRSTSYKVMRYLINKYVYDK